MISYEPFFDTMKKKNISSYWLIMHGLSKGGRGSPAVLLPLTGCVR